VHGAEAGIGEHDVVTYACTPSSADLIERDLPLRAEDDVVGHAESFYDARGRVYLELADATPAETARGMAMLTKLVG